MSGGFSLRRGTQTCNSRTCTLAAKSAVDSTRLKIVAHRTSHIAHQLNNRLLTRTKGTNFLCPGYISWV